jgi:hypothetical protein
VAVSTESLQVRWVVVPTITVYVVYVKLTAVFRNESAMQAGIFLVQGVWVLVLLNVSFIDSLATVLTSKS